MSWLNAGGGLQKQGGLRAKFKVAQAMDYTQQNPGIRRPPGLCHYCASRLEHELDDRMECTHVSGKSGNDSNNRFIAPAAEIGNIHVVGTDVQHENWQTSSSTIGKFTGHDALGWLTFGDEKYDGSRGRTLPPQDGSDSPGFRPPECVNAASAMELPGNQELTRASGFNQIQPGTEKFHSGHYHLNRKPRAEYPREASNQVGWNEYGG